MSSVEAAESEGVRAHRSALAFFDELAACGVRHVVVSPGSRSTPLAVAARHHGHLRIWIQVDERVAAFFGLGLARATGTPAVLVCTSGTAAMNYHPAVVEADLGRTPLIVCTADRPPELSDVGAPQTVHQHGLYGRHVRWQADLPVGGELGGRRARQIAARAHSEAMGLGDPGAGGPVHCNWPFRKPLEPGPDLAELVVDSWSDGVEQRVRVHDTPRRPSDAQLALLREVAEVARGVVVLGPMLDRGAIAGAVSFAEGAGWPVLAEVASGARFGTAAASEAMCPAPALAVSSAPAPEVIVAVGGPPTSAAVAGWLDGAHVNRRVHIDAGPHFIDPSANVTDFVRCDPGQALAAAARVLDRSDTGWAAWWSVARAALAAFLATELADATTSASDGGLTEPLVAMVLADACRDATNWWLSSSLPIRDVEVHAGARVGDVEVWSNRGANGIDGVISSAGGLAAGTGRPTLLSIGDLALLHDLGGLAAMARGGVDLCVVVTDNDGGGIFDYLPIAELAGVVAVEQLFSTPHGTDLGAVISMPGVDVHRPAGPIELDAVLGPALIPGAGVSVVVVEVDRSASERHRESIRRRAKDQLPPWPMPARGASE